MKKYAAVICAALLLAGCGGNSDNDELTSTTETEITTEESTTKKEKNQKDEDTTEREEREEETLNQQEDAEDKADVNTAGEDTSAPEETEVNFSDSDAYKELESLAANAGFEISLNDNNVVFRTYITDDTIDYINEKNEDYYNKWNESCGLYEEFSSEALRIIRNNNVENINVIIEATGSSDNQVYFRNENGVSVYNAYNE